MGEDVKVLAALLSWTTILSSVSLLLWYLWSYIYDGTPFNDGLLDKINNEQIILGAGYILAASFLISLLALALSTLKMKMRWIFSSDFTQLDDTHSLVVEAGLMGKTFKLKKPSIFVYRRGSASMLNLASFANSAIAFDEEILKPRHGDEYRWLLARCLYIHTTMYSWMSGLLVGVLWPLWFGRFILNISRRLFGAMQHQNHYLILAILFLPFCLTGIILLAIGKLIYLIQSPVQKKILNKITKTANQKASNLIRLDSRQILDQHLGSVDLFPGQG